jgi:hypothetical protein
MRTIAVTTTYPVEALSLADVVVTSLDDVTVGLVESLRRK